jgi:hypothetical protein
MMLLVADKSVSVSRRWIVIVIRQNHWKIVDLDRKSVRLLIYAGSHCALVIKEDQMKYCLACVVAMLFVILTGGCGTTKTASTTTSVQNHSSKKSDRWYDIRRDRSISFGEFRTGPITQYGSQGSKSKIRLAGFGVNKGKAHNSLEFKLHGPGSSVEVRCGGHVKQKDTEFLGVELPTNVSEDHFRGTIQFENASIWSFHLDGFNHTTVLDKLSGTIETDSGPITIRKSNSGSRLLATFDGFSGAVFEWQGQTVGEISKRVTLNGSMGDISVSPNAPPQIRLAVAAVASALLLAQKVEADTDI